MKIIPSRLLNTLIALLLLTSITIDAGSAQTSLAQHTLFIAGSPGEGVYAAMLQAALSRPITETIDVLIIPTAMVPEGAALSADDRQVYLLNAENERQRIERSCLDLAGENLECRVEVAPLLSRNDARSLDHPTYFHAGLEAIVLLGDFPATFMEEMGGTPVEEALIEANQRGALIAGIGRSSALFSVAMIRGYQSGAGPGSALYFGAVDLWTSAERHGLLFGLSNGLIDAPLFGQGNPARMLNAIALPEAPHLGILTAEHTGASLVDNRFLQRVTGRQAVAVLDAETYHAADGVHYHGCIDPQRCQPVVSMKNILFHLLPPGGFNYDVTTRLHSLAAPLERVERRFTTLTLPLGAGDLYLSGILQAPLVDSQVLSKFISVHGGPEAQWLVIAAGYADATAAQSVLDMWSATLPVNTQVITLPPGTDRPIDLPADLSAVILLAEDSDLIPLVALQPLYRAWLDGLPLLAEGPAAAIIGASFTVTTTPGEQELFEARPGLNLLKISITPLTSEGQNWNPFISQAIAEPDLVSFGLSPDTAIEINGQRAQAIGLNAVYALDLRQAQLDTGSNQAPALANGLLDIFAPGDLFQPEVADINLVVSPPATPELATPTVITQFTSTSVPTATPEHTSTPPAPTFTPTRTPRPTSTPLAIPPPSNPVTSSWLVAFGVLIVVVILFGILLNRQRFN